MSQRDWNEHARWCIGHYPLMRTDWDAHRRGIQLSAETPAHLVEVVPYFDVEPMSPEDEEQAASILQTALQLELF